MKEELSEKIVDFFHGKTIALFTNIKEINELKSLLIKCIAACRNKSNLDQQKANIQKLFSEVSVHFNHILKKDISDTMSFPLFFPPNTSNVISQTSSVDKSVSSSSSQPIERTEVRLPEFAQECWTFMANSLLDEIVEKDELHPGGAYLRGAGENNHDVLLLIHVIYTHIFGDNLYVVATQIFQDNWLEWSNLISKNLMMMTQKINNPNNYYLRQLWLNMLADNLLVMPADKDYKNNKLDYLIYNFYFKMIMSFKVSSLNKDFTLANPAKIGKNDFCPELLTLLQYMFMPLLQTLAKIDTSMYHLTEQRNQAWVELSGLIGQSLETRLTAVSEAVVDTSDVFTASPTIASSSTPAAISPSLVSHSEQDDVFESLLAAWLLKKQTIAMALQTSSPESSAPSDPSSGATVAPHPVSGVGSVNGSNSARKNFHPNSLLGHTPSVHTPRGQTGGVPTCTICSIL